MSGKPVSVTALVRLPELSLEEPAVLAFLDERLHREAREAGGACFRPPAGTE
jgi:hypothetical protein